MDPIKINVNVEVGLKQTTLEALAAIFNPWKGCTCANIESDPQPEPEKPLPEPKRTAKNAEPATAEPSAPVDDDDLPPDDTPTQKKATPSEDDARKAVKAARDRGVPAKTIKEFMKETFDIASSVECPAERRQELIDGLNKLAA